MKLSHILVGFKRWPISFGLVFLSSIALIGLIIYRLTHTLSKDEKKKVSYGEIALSLLSSGTTILSSLMVILFMFSSIFFLVYGLLFKVKTYGPTRKSLSGMDTILYIISFALLSIVLTPLVLTIIRGALEDRLTTTQDKILSIATILSSMYIAYVILRRAAFWGFMLHGVK
jgi:hypothetical protein